MYLPQFHEFEENNQWWGKGFTEWTCVERARVLAPGHVIKYPHPDIGYYCLEDREIRKKQADMAKSYGVYGFCYYHYWFHGKVLMQKTLEMTLADNEPDIPFCLSWANEQWTRKMNGGNGEVTQPQFYGRETEWEQHLQYLLPFFRHRNYIQVDGQPMFVIYRISQITDYPERFAYWKRRLKEEGFEGMHVVMTVGPFPREECYPIVPHVDAAFDFYPNFLRSPDTVSYERDNIAFCEMDVAWRRMCNDKPFHPVHYRGIMVGFDNTPRSPLRGCAFINGTSQGFESALRKQVHQSQEQFLFVNSWNEWGEQAALEPDDKEGYSYLEALQRGIKRVPLYA